MPRIIFHDLNLVQQTPEKKPGVIPQHENSFAETPLSKWSWPKYPGVPRPMQNRLHGNVRFHLRQNETGEPVYFSISNSNKHSPLFKSRSNWKHAEVVILHWIIQNILFAEQRRVVCLTSASKWERFSRLLKNSLVYLNWICNTRVPSSRRWD